MLFDHGCDSITAFVTTMAMARLMSLNDTQWAWSVVLTTIMFFFAILEQYYTHTLLLRIVNHVNEGMCLVILMGLITCITGSDFWLLTVGGIQLNSYVLIFLFINFFAGIGVK